MQPCKSSGHPDTGRNPRIGLRLPAETNETVTAVAIRDGVSVSEELRRLVDKGLTAG